MNFPDDRVDKMIKPVSVLFARRKWLLNEGRFTQLHYAAAVISADYGGRNTRPEFACPQEVGASKSGTRSFWSCRSAPTGTVNHCRTCSPISTLGLVYITDKTKAQDSHDAFFHGFAQLN